MLNLSLSTPAALRNAASKHLEKGEVLDAEFCLTEVLRRNINDDAALALLGQMYLVQQRLIDAFSYYVLAINANPNVLKHKQKLVQIVPNIPVGTYNAATDRAIVEVLKSAREIDCSGLRLLWLTHMLTVPEFDEAFHLDGKDALDPELQKHFDSFTDYKPLLQPIFLLGIENFVIYNPLFENFIGSIRKQLLSDMGQSKNLSREETVILCSAVAHYCFNTDYIVYGTPEEMKKVAEIRASIESGEKANDPLTVGLLACYVPLFKLSNRLAVLQAMPANSDIARLAQTQIGEFEALRKTAETIEAITTIDDAVSLKVQEQYEEFPYPKWKALPDTTILSGWRMNEDDKKTIGARLTGKRAKILNAGCGTGMEASVFAHTFPDAKVTAVDLSRASLAYATNKIKEFGIKNIIFKQADILKLGSLDQKYDCIVSGGVIHHIADPVGAWRTLCGLLKDDGYMMIALYSKIARRGIIDAQNIVKKGNYSGDAETMKAFRTKAGDVLGRDTFMKVLHFADYYYLNMYRDMLFHVQETNYDLLEIRDILDELGLEFVSFWSNGKLNPEYDAMFKDDPKRTNLANWHTFEGLNPTTFSGMYAFWCKKKEKMA